MNKVITVPKVEETDYSKLESATEIAFISLVDRILQNGLLQADPGMAKNLMYLPSQEVIQQFKDACMSVVKCLQEAVQPIVDSEQGQGIV